MLNPMRENTKNLSNLFHGQTQRLAMERNRNFGPDFWGKILSSKSKNTSDGYILGTLTSWQS